MTTDLQIAGKMAQFGRGIVADVSASLVDSFASALRSELTANGNSTDSGTTPARTERARPALSLFALIGAVIRRRAGRIFRRRGHAQL
jgi:hypothetical protein